MSGIVVNRALAGGEIAPSLYPRHDMGKYGSWLRRMRNWVPLRNGGAGCRPGTPFAGEAKDSTKRARLLPFIFNQNVNQVYALEFGNLSIRFYKAYELDNQLFLGDQVLEAESECAISQANPAVVTQVGHGYATGDEVRLISFLPNETGMPTIMNQNYKITVTSADTFTLKRMNGSNLNTTGIGPHTGNTTCARVYSIASPYTDEEVFDLSYAQSADVIFIAHHLHPLQELIRTDETQWTISEVVVGSKVGKPTILYAGGLGAGSHQYRWKITAIDELSREESDAGGEMARAIATTDNLNPVAVQTTGPHGYVSGDEILIDGVSTMTQINGRSFIVTVPVYAPVTIATADNLNPVMVTTSSNHNLTTGDYVFISGVATMTQINGRTFQVTVVDGDTFTLDGENGTSYSDGTGGTMLRLADEFTLNGEDGTGYTDGTGGTATRPYTRIDGVAQPTSNVPASLTIVNLVSGATRYAIYRAEEGGEYAFVGYAKGTPFKDGLTVPPDPGDSPPTHRNPFEGVGNYPSWVAIVQQRLAAGGSDNDPERSWLSETGRYRNFSLVFPRTDDGSIDFICGTGTVNRTRSMLEIGRPILWTEGGEHELQGNEAGNLTPEQVNPKQQSANGMSTIRPLQVNAEALYVQAQGSIIRSLGYKVESDGYLGDELTVFSSHLVDGFTIVDWAYQKTPDSIVWAVRNDGVLLSLTYNREQDIFAWARHDTDGEVESVCALPEGTQTALWMIVRRIVGNRIVRYVERMAPMFFKKVEDAIRLDCAKTYDGRNHNPSLQMAMSGGTTWKPPEEIDLLANDAFFRSSHVGQQIHIKGKDSAGRNTTIRLTITSVNTTPMIPTARAVPDKLIPATMRNVGLSEWALAKDTLTDLWHLEGKYISAFGDGFVLASPNNKSHTKIQVVDGTATFDHHYGVIHVGLPITNDLETLDVNQANGVTIADEQKLVRGAVVFIESSRGIWIGPKPPPDDTVDSLKGLKPLRLREQVSYDDPPELVTRAEHISILSEWNSHGRLFLRQVDPVPATVLSIAADGLFPFKG